LLEQLEESVFVLAEESTPIELDFQLERLGAILVRVAAPIARSTHD
jgi:hypothetical protein